MKTYARHKMLGTIWCVEPTTEQGYEMRAWREDETGERYPFSERYYSLSTFKETYVMLSEPGAVRPEKQGNALFDTAAGARLAKAAELCQGRGAEYGDTLREGAWLALRAVARRFVPEGVTREQARALAMAALVDIKYARFIGGYREDHVDDCINYLAVLPEMIALAEGTKLGIDKGDEALPKVPPIQGTE